MRRYDVLAIMASLFLSNVAWAAAAMSEADRTIEVTKAQPHFAVRLKSNPTTGYSWALVGYDKNVIQYLGHNVHAAHSDLVGAPGSESFRFKVLDEGFTAPKKTQIFFQYKRSWEKSTNQPKLIITVNTKP